MGINTAWCEEFSKLRKLNGITWVCVEEECIDSKDLAASPLENGGIMTAEERAQMTAVTRKMEDVIGVVPPPNVYVMLLDEENFEQWDELFDEYEED